jgi:hypothetical protein
MTEEEREAEIILWGIKARELIDNDNYIEIFERIKAELADEILATSMTEKDQRENLYLIYNGMRAFGDRLAGLAKAGLDILSAKDTEGREAFDFEDDDIFSN